VGRLTHSDKLNRRFNFVILVIGYRVICYLIVCRRILMRCSKTWMAIMFLFSFISIALGQNSNATIISEILKNEKRIKDVQANVKWYEPETNNILVVFEWGWENGKEFINGHKWLGKDKKEPTTEIKYAFNGEVQRNFRQNRRESWSTGGIFGFTPDTFNVYMAPKALLGYSIKQHGQETFGHILSKAKELTIREQTEEINGHECCVVEAKWIEDGDCIYDVRACIDTKRDFRPLKIEKFSSPECKNADASKHWQALVIRIDNIELEQIDGVWFPITGDRSFFTNEWVLPKGITEEEFKRSFSHLTEEEQMKKLRHTTVPQGLTRRIEIKMVKINKGINPENFTIKFPLDCRVWDDFRQIGYVIGGSSALSEIASLEVKESKSPNMDQSPESALADITSEVGEQEVEPAIDENSKASKPRHELTGNEKSETEESNQKEHSNILGKVSYAMYFLSLLLVLILVGVVYAMRKPKTNC